MTTQFAPIWDDAAVAFTTIKANATDTASAAATTLLDLQVNNVSKFVVDKFGELIITPTARTSGSDPLISLIAPADTTRAAGTPAPDITIGLNRTVEFASNTTITDQRAIVIERPTYAFALPNGRIETPSTVHIAGEPLMGPNWIFNVQRYALSIGSGTVRFWSANQLNPAFQLGSYAWGPFLYNNGWTWSGVAGGLMRMSPAGGILLSNSLYFGFTDNGFTDTPSAGFFQDATGIIAQRNGTNSQTFRLYNTFTDSSNCERLALQFGTYSSARHAQIAAESAGTGTANINLVLTPKGTGAFILGPPPDGTTTGGNARGANAVDLQTGRSAASEVATGSFAFAANRRATVTGESSFGAGGNSGGGPNVSGPSCFGFGREVTVDAAYYAAAFGYIIQQSSPFGFAVGVGLDLNSLECQYSFGRHHINRAVGTFTAGHAARADKIGQRASAIGNFAVAGDAQISEMILRGTTTTNAAVVLQLGPSTNASAADLLIPSGKVCQFLLIITGVRNGGADVASYMRQVTIKNISGTTSIVGTVNTIGTDEAAGTSLSVTANNTTDSLDVAPTGVSGQTWRWECVVYGGEIGHG